MTLSDRFIAACNAIGFRIVDTGEIATMGGVGVTVMVGSREHVFEFRESGRIIATEILYNCDAELILRDYTDHPSPLKALFSLLCEADQYRREHLMLDGIEFSEIGPDDSA